MSRGSLPCWRALDGPDVERGVVIVSGAARSRSWLSRPALGKPRRRLDQHSREDVVRDCGPGWGDSLSDPDGILLRADAAVMNFSVSGEGCPDRGGTGGTRGYSKGNSSSEGALVGGTRRYRSRSRVNTGTTQSPARHRLDSEFLLGVPPVPPVPPCI